MILIDTNYFVDIFVLPANEVLESRRARALSLLRQVEQNEVQAILPEVVIHECYFVLSMRLNILETSVFVDVFRSLLTYPGWSMGSGEIGILSRGLDILAEHPKLEFSDAVIAARAEACSAELATSDTRLAKAYSGKIWSGE